MSVIPPTREELERIANSHFLAPTPAELDNWTAQMPMICEMLAVVESMDEGLPPVPERDPGRRPQPGEDPLNAVLRLVSIKEKNEGKLAGKRIGLKDTVCVAGVPLRCASNTLEGYTPEVDATIVRRILDAGGEIRAILNMDAWACDGTGATGSYGRILNPYKPEHQPGGSSGGSGAALKYDYIDMTVGGDQAGSIRIPASFCGVVGLKPTYSLVPYTGIVGADASFDHAGPMARKAADVALLLEVMAGPDPLDGRQRAVAPQEYTKALGAKDLRGLRVGVLREGFEWDVTEPEVAAAVRGAPRVLRELGAEIIELSLPAHRRAMPLFMSVAPEALLSIAEGNGTGYQLNGWYNSGLAAAMGCHRRERAKNLPPTIKTMMILGSYLRRDYPQFYAKGQNLRARLRAEYDRLLDEVDVLLMPTVAFKPPRHESDADSAVNNGLAVCLNTVPFDLTGHPALSFPCGMAAGLPIGAMLVGRHFDEARMLRVVDAFEHCVNWQAL